MCVHILAVFLFLYSVLKCCNFVIGSLDQLILSVLQFLIVFVFFHLRPITPKEIERMVQIINKKFSAIQVKHKLEDMTMTYDLCLINL